MTVNEVEIMKIKTYCENTQKTPQNQRNEAVLRRTMEVFLVRAATSLSVGPGLSSIC